MSRFRLKVLTLFRTQVDKHLTCHTDTEDMESAPPPPPPKDTYRFAYDMTLTSRDKPLPDRGSSPLKPHYASPSPPVAHAYSQSHAPVTVVYPYPRRRHRSEPAEAHEFIDAAAEEVQRQARLKLEKQAALLQQAAEDEQRKRTLDAELHYAATIRRQREAQERAVEEQKRQEIDARRTWEKEKRMAEARKLQEWREQQVKRTEEVAMSKSELRKRKAEERRNRDLSSPNLGSSTDDDLVSGWVTVQAGDSLMSKRRYCVAGGHELKFYKDSSGTSQLMETIDASDIVKVSDNEDEFYDLELLQHAFGLQLRNGKTFIIITDVAHHTEDFITAAIQLAGL
ncbi:hypothetical protein EUX98_g1824 [Antrodiella citrinella]|uniref:PH domain-containing protein n=1 Tax=Antrodiella citrinella TaxID=2447956 RepID=A0A4V3XJB1_9APHY|nr:hypothetical protein EUX98_g1824 [Antrodiella citrinella]